MGFLIGTYLSILAIFLILLVLVQRGRGGGLTGALGGMGGSSAFGAKAGDIFTRITIVVASVWIASCALAGFWANSATDRLGGMSAPLVPDSRPGGESPSSESTPVESTSRESISTEPAPPTAATGGDAESNAAAEPSAPATEAEAP
jgi:preprotein translocase subunit SecG